MPAPSSRRRFWRYMILVLAIAAAVYAVTRVINTAQDHERAAQVAQG